VVVGLVERLWFVVVVGLEGVGVVVVVVVVVVWLVGVVVVGRWVAGIGCRVVEG